MAQCTSPFASLKPTEKDLDFVVSSAGDNWRSLLTHLGIKLVDIESFQNGRTTKDACFKGLVHWLKGNVPDEPVTFGTLFKALEDSAMTGCISLLEEKLKARSPLNRAAQGLSTQTNSVHRVTDSESRPYLLHSSLSELTDTVISDEAAASHLGIVAALDLSEGTPLAQQRPCKDKWQAKDPPARRLHDAFFRLQSRLAKLFNKHIDGLKPFLRICQKNAEWPFKKLEVKNIDNAHTFQEIFDKVCIEDFWLNTHMLIRLIWAVPDNKARRRAKQRLEAYHKLLGVFSKFVLVKRIPEDDARLKHFRSSLLPKLRITHDNNYDDYTVSELLEQQEFLSRRFNIPREVFHFVEAESTNSTLVTWALSISSEKVFIIFQWAAQEFWSLKENSVIRFEIEGVLQLHLTGKDLLELIKEALQCNYDFLSCTEHVSRQFLALVDYSQPKRRNSELPSLKPLLPNSVPLSEPGVQELTWSSDDTHVKAYPEKRQESKLKRTTTSPTDYQCNQLTPTDVSKKQPDDTSQNKPSVTKSESRHTPAAVNLKSVHNDRQPQRQSQRNYQYHAPDSHSHRPANPCFGDYLEKANKPKSKKSKNKPKEVVITNSASELQPSLPSRTSVQYQQGSTGMLKSSPSSEKRNALSQATSTSLYSESLTSAQAEVATQSHQLEPLLQKQSSTSAVEVKSPSSSQVQLSAPDRQKHLPSLSTAAGHGCNDSRIPNACNTSRVSTLQGSSGNSEIQRFANRRPYSLDRSYPLPTKEELEHPARLKILDEPLSSSNYKEKFHTLLYWEELEHERVLTEKCDGNYTVAPSNYVPKNVLSKLHIYKINPKQVWEIVGLTEDACEKANQAATDAILFTTSDKLHCRIIGSSTTGEFPLLYVGPPTSESANPNLCGFREKAVFVQFQLKYSYFENLHSAIEGLDELVVNKIVSGPAFDKSSLHYAMVPNIEQNSLPQNFWVDAEYQQIALQKLISSRSNLPYLITGPFGTGKTRVLAVAAYHFLCGASSPRAPSWSRGRPIRVLLVTHHMQTADSYLDVYFGPLEKILKLQFDTVRLVGRNYKYSGKYNHLLQQWRSDSLDFNPNDGNRLIITTLLTAPHLLKLVQQGYFTHILVDEAAQAREPEVLAPLALADSQTKIVLAGDHLQVGPKTLVLGERAREGDLGTSILVRLNDCYKAKEIHHYSSCLLNNFRSNSGILRLPSFLFYESSLQACAPSKTHPKAEFPLQFICTSLDKDLPPSSDESLIQRNFEKEAITLLQTVEEYVREWPIEWGIRDLSSICILAPMRHQQRVLKNLITTRFSSLMGTTCNVAFDIQGREYRAIFACTSEPVNPDFSSANPIKSICDKFVFNTVVTRAQSLVVAVGNPYRLFQIEEKSPNGQGCWKAYIRNCFEGQTLKVNAGQANSTDEMQKLQNLIVCEIVTSLRSKETSEVLPESDSILEAYAREVERRSDVKRARMTLTFDRETGKQDWIVTSTQAPAQPVQSSVKQHGLDQCFNDRFTLEQQTGSRCIATPLRTTGQSQDKIRKEVHIDGVKNRRGAFNGAEVAVEIFKTSHADQNCGYGKVIKVFTPGIDCNQFLCTVSPSNSNHFFPVDRKSPKIINLPSLDRAPVTEQSRDLGGARDHHKVRLQDVICFDPSSVKEGAVPKIRLSIPMKIAQDSFFIVMPLKWSDDHPFPLGVVVGVIPRGDIMSRSHVERLLKLQYRIEEDSDSDIYEGATHGNLGPDHAKKSSEQVDWDEAITIDSEKAKTLDDALTIKRVPSTKNENEAYQFGVHIPYLLQVLRVGDQYSDLAEKLIRSVYDQPMLPKKFTERFSLNLGEARSAISVIGQAVLIDSDTVEISDDVKFSLGFVRSRDRLSYEQAEKHLTAQAKMNPATKEQYSLPEKLDLLFRISNALRKSRMKDQGSTLFSASSSEEMKSPLANGLVKEMMIWTNSQVAKKLLQSRLPKIVLRIQEPPSIVELAKFEKQYGEILESNVQFCGSATACTSTFLMVEDVRRCLVDLLQKGLHREALFLLTAKFLHPQVAVVFHNTQASPPKYRLIENPHKIEKCLEHYDLKTVYTQFSAPLRRAIDIVVQRMLINTLQGNADTVSPKYTSMSLSKFVDRCNTKTRQAKNFERDMEIFDHALYCSRSSTCVTAYVAKIERGKIKFLFQDTTLESVSYSGGSIKTALLMTPAKGEATPKSDTMCKWKVWVSSASSTPIVQANTYLSVASSRSTQPETGKQTAIQYFNEEGEQNGSKRLQGKKAVANHRSNVIQISPNDWSQMQQFIQSPTSENAQLALSMLAQYDSSDPRHEAKRVCVTPSNLPKERAVSKTSQPSHYELLPKSNMAVGLQNCAFMILVIPVEISEFGTYNVWLGAKASDYILTPAIQLIELAPCLDLCIQHLENPASCYAPKALRQASKCSYNSIKEYVSLWEDVFLAEAVSTSVCSIKESLKMILIHNILIEWPILEHPTNAIDEPYFVPSPSGQITIELTDGNTCHSDFFSLEIGTLICARYCIQINENEIEALRKLYRRKHDKEITGKNADERLKTKLLGKNAGNHIRAVYHMVVVRVDSKNSKIVLEIKGDQNKRVSEVMKCFLNGNQTYTCSVELIRLATHHHRVYQALRTMPKLLQQDHPHLQVLLNRKSNRKWVSRDLDAFLMKNADIFYLWNEKRHRQLNEMQKQALKQAMLNPFQVIQGPPGTGKSVTGAHLAYAFALWKEARPSEAVPSIIDGKSPCVLYCGPSNKSVDVVLRLLEPLKDKVRILRIYGKMIEQEDYPGSKHMHAASKSDHKCPEDLQEYALHHKVHRKSFCRREIEKTETKFLQLKESNSIPTSNDCTQYKKLITAAENEIITSGQYQIVLCTTNECFSPRFRKFLYPSQVIIDEAAMAMEPECLASICQTKGNVVLIGDHKQLQPIIDNNEAKINGLRLSLFERLTSMPSEFGEEMVSEIPITCLEVQYRMNESVCDLPSKLFYKGKLTADDTVKNSCEGVLKHFWPKENCPVVFYDMSSHTKAEEDGSQGEGRVVKYSKSNTCEAKEVVKVVAELLFIYLLKPEDVAVLTPYFAQKKIIKKLLEEKDEEQRKTALGNGVLSRVKVQTITESQGSEFPIVVLSTVRTQPFADIENEDVVQPDRVWMNEKLGFLTDPHQLCVGITRSKYGLIIFGNSVLLSYDVHWRELVEHYKRKGCLRVLRYT